MYLSSIKFLKPGELAFQSLIFNGYILILMEKVVYFELALRKSDLFPTKLILKFDQFILKLDSFLSLVI